MPLLELLLRRHREKTILAVLVAVSLALLLLPDPVQVGIGRTVLNAAFAPIQRATHFVGELTRVRAENRRLQRLVASLMLERERLNQFRAERERLRRIAEFKEEQFLQLVPCEVIGRNLDRFQTLLTVDKGRRDGIDERMPVLSYQGYVGRVARVFDDSAWVQLIASRNSPVSCLDKRSRVVGILEWRDHSNFGMANVSLVEDVQVGDTLITSGYGGVAPKGFPVAVVTHVTPSVDGLRLDVSARSHIDFRSLEELFVVTDEIEWDRAIIYSDEDSTLVEEALRE